MIKKIKFLSSVLALLLCLTASAFGQETTGSIEGTVKDPNGAVVPGAQVTITSSGATSGARPDATTGFNRTATADENGFFRVLQVPPGFYTVSVAPTAGFGTATVNNVEVVLGKTTPINVALSVSGQTVNVNVSSADVSAIDPTDNKIQTNITAQVAELLPKGTNFTSLLKVSPSTRPEPLSGGFQVDGASGSENTFIIDGQEVTNFRTGVLNTANNLPFQMVQEVQVKSSGFEAEYGGATGGVINVVSKGGSNEWHGEFGMQFRPSRLQSNPTPFLRRFATGSVAAGTFFDTSEYIHPRKDAGVDQFPTANFGGPIIKNKAWFFASYTPQFINVERTLEYFVQTAFNSSNIPSGTIGTTDPRGARPIVNAQTYHYHQMNNYAFARLDTSPSDKLRVGGTFTWNPVVVRGALPAFSEVLSGPQFYQPTTGSTPQIGAQFLDNQGGRQNANNVSGHADWTPNSKAVISIRAGRSFLNEKLGSYGLPTQTRYLCSASSTTSGATLGGCFPGFSNFGSNFQIDHDVSIRKTLDADATYLVSNLGGRHQFKGGYQYNGISNDVKEGYKDTGIVVLLYGVNIANLTGQTPTAGNLGSGYLQRFATQGAASSKSQSVYIQDSWQPFKRLTLNLGLRAEKEGVPSFGASNPGINFGWGDKIAPRLGFALDVFGDGKTKIFGFWGRFYDRFKYELPRGSFGGDFYRRDYFEILSSRGANYTNYTVANILGGTADKPGGVCPGGDTGVNAPIGAGYSVCQFDFRIPSNLVGGSIFEGGAVDPNLKAFRQSELTFGAERDLGGGFLASGRYTRKRVDRAIEDIGIPTAGGSEAYIIGNPGFGLAHDFAKQNGFPDVKAIRNYDALELRIDKRFNRKYYFNANYTFSKLFGNYPGLANSYESGRTSPSVNRLFDLPFAAFTANGQAANGRLPTDRPHVFKLYGAYTFDWGGNKTHSTEFSGFTTAESGTPLTTIYTLYNLSPAFLNLPGDLGRTHKFSQTDFAIRHKYRFGNDGRFTLVADMDILNLFNQANELTRQTTFTSLTNITASNLATVGCTACTGEITTINRIFNGGIHDYVVNYVNALASRQTSTFNKSNSFQSPREIRFGFRLLF